MTLPALSALRLNFPESCLEVLTRPWALAIYQGQPEVAAVRALAADGLHRGFFGRLRLARELASEGYDLAVLFQNAFEAAALTALARIPERWGYARDGRAFLLSRAVTVKERDRYVHQAFYYLNFLEKIGLKAPFSRPRLSPLKESLLEANSHLYRSGGQPDSFLLALAPGAAFGSAKRWPAKNFAAAALMILAELPDHQRARIMIMGGPGEIEVAYQLAGLLPPRQTLNLAGKTSLSTAIALLSRASLLISNDSGMMHVGGGLNIPLVAVFGPTDPLTTAPLGHSRLIRSEATCAPCLKRNCPLDRQHCFDQVTPERVAAAGLELILNPLEDNGPGRAVFLDRDGTLIEEVNFLKNPDQVRLIPGAGRAVAALNQAGYKVVMVTNQSGLARGLFSLDDLKLVHRRLALLLAEEGARLDAIYFCPHHPEAAVAPEWSGPCDCRKPALGLFEKAVTELNLDPRRSVWVGDLGRDLAAAEHYGGRSVLVLTGYGLKEAKERKFTPTLVAPDLRRAVEWIL